MSSLKRLSGFSEPFQVNKSKGLALMQTAFPTFAARPATRQNLTHSNTTATQNSHSHNTLTTDKVYFSGRDEEIKKIKTYERLLQAMSIDTTTIKDKALKAVNQEIKETKPSGYTSTENSINTYKRTRAQANALRDAYLAATSNDDAAGESE
jgi:hypothetical protein